MISRGTRVALDIKAGNPVILVPRSAKSSHVLVADLGNLTLSNEFLWQGSLGTLGYSSARSRAQHQTEFGKLFGIMSFFFNSNRSGSVLIAVSWKVNLQCYCCS